MTVATRKIPDCGLKDVGLHEQITAISNLADQDFYAVDKLEAHVSNIHHIAISIFVFSGDRMLLQRRAKTKYHSAGLWANTVCSHPRWNETAHACAQRRLIDELRWQVPLTAFGKIDYSAKVGNLFENEHVHCFYGKHNTRNDVSNFNTVEVEAVEWLTIPEILRQIRQYPQRYTEWFKICMADHQGMIDEIIGQQAYV